MNTYGRFSLVIPAGALKQQRVALGFVIALVGGPLLTWLLYSVAGRPESITSDVLAYPASGRDRRASGRHLARSVRPAGAVRSHPQLPVRRSEVHPHDRRPALPVVRCACTWIIAILVSYIVDQAARRARVAQRAAAEAELLALGRGQRPARAERSGRARQSRTREAFGMAGVRLLDADGARVIATDGEPVRDEQFTSVPIGAGSGALREGARTARTAAGGPRRGDCSMSSSRNSGAAIERTELTATAREADALAATDQVRTAHPLGGQSRHPPSPGRCSGRDRRPACCGRPPHRRRIVAESCSTRRTRASPPCRNS